MEEYIKHIRDERTSNESKKDISYCGEDLSMQFHFVDVTHAVCERQTRGRLLPCPECKKIVIELLNNED